MTREDFEFVAELVKRHSGLALTADKAYLVESRLAPIAVKIGMKGLPDLLAALRAGRDLSLPKAVADAMTTNETSFFRDTTPFTLFREKVLPSLLEKRAGTKSIRIWCAAASTGQEPYSLAMILREQADRLKGWKVEIVGTDICAKVLDRARQGVYSAFEVQRGLSTAHLQRHFTKAGDAWAIAPEVKAMVSFREFKLLDSLRSLGQFDIVFCRNVLIYFDFQTKARVLGEIGRIMPDDGRLFLGGAETVFGISDAFLVVAGCRGVFAPTRTPALKAGTASPSIGGLTPVAA